MKRDAISDLLDQGVITDTPPQYWRPLQTKNRKWSNYFVGKNGVMFHLTDGWMINEQDMEITQIKQSADES